MTTLQPVRDFDLSSTYGRVTQALYMSPQRPDVILTARNDAYRLGQQVQAQIDKMCPVLLASIWSDVGHHHITAEPFKLGRRMVQANRPG